MNLLAVNTTRWVHLRLVDSRSWKDPKLSKNSRSKALKSLIFQFLFYQADILSNALSFQFFSYETWSVLTWWASFDAPDTIKKCDTLVFSVARSLLTDDTVAFSTRDTRRFWLCWTLINKGSKAQEISGVLAISTSWLLSGTRSISFFDEAEVCDENTMKNSE